ncbi:BRISC complex subunit FAM175B [Diachasma alloeum]|uniref:BRISC complex subunit FAM175B n=1 Tax=Diachasma alloeum TaxID=454923 RepID=UPI00073830FF|nr:BRISC complex subunit FAM175B [Diachasma alloeum]
MADNGLMVTISGAALSLLFYENARSRGDQMGFLLGEVLSLVTKNVTDLERHVESVKVHVDIQSIVKCSPTDQIYDSGGKVNEDKLKDLIKDKGKSVVGWFRFRRNASLTPTLRDKIVHKQFLSIFRGASNQINENYFVVCMLNASVSPGEGTHKFKHVFLHYKQGMYNAIPLRINNLGHDATKHDGSDYKPTPIKYSDEPDSFTMLVKSLNLDLARTPGVESICKIEEAAEQHLEQIVPLVVKTDREVALLEKMVMEARQELFEKCMQKEIERREKCIIETKCRLRRERDKFQRIEESTSRNSTCQDDFLLGKETSATSKQKTLHSLALGSRISPNNEHMLNPFATNKKPSYSQATKKHTESMFEDSDPNCR